MQIETGSTPTPRTPPSAMKSPRDKPSSPGAVRFQNEAKSLPPKLSLSPEARSPNRHHDPRSPMKQRESICEKVLGMTISPPVGPQGMTPLSGVRSTPESIAQRLTLLHGMIIASEQMPPQVKKTCHDTLMKLDRLLIPTTRVLTEQHEKRMAEEAAKNKAATSQKTGALQNRARAETTEERLARKKQEEESMKKRLAAMAIPVGKKPPPKATSPKLSASMLASSSGSSPGAKNASSPPGNTPPISARSGSDTASGISALSGLSARNRQKIRQQQIQKSWNRFARLAAKELSNDELKLLSLNTLRSLLHHYHVDNDPVDVANIELQWRIFAQQREDQRHSKSVMHKSCEAVDTKSATAAARQLSATFDKPTNLRT